MTGRGTLYVLLTVVAGAAGMLSFAALRDLAELCGFARSLAWLLPVVIDAGAAAGSLVWLAAGTGEPARRFARRLALGLLALSVAANALGHGLAAYVLLPPWWVVVILSGVAPAVLGAMVHLAVLVGHRAAHDDRPALDRLSPDDELIPYHPTHGPVEVDTNALAADEVGALDDHGLSHRWDDAPAADDPDPTSGRTAALIAAGVGRRWLSRELGVTEYEARRLLDRTRTTPPDRHDGNALLASDTNDVSTGVRS